MRNKTKKNIQEILKTVDIKNVTSVEVENAIVISKIKNAPERKVFYV